MRAGFQRIYDMMGDISIDVPQVSTDIMQHEFQLNDMLSSETKAYIRFSTLLNIVL